MAQQGATYGKQQQQYTAVDVGNGYKAPEKDYLALSIFNMLCCCFCVGIAAIIKSLDVRSANERGDPVAKSHSQSALKLNKIGIGLGIVVHVIWIILVIVLVAVVGIGVSQATSNSIDTFNSIVSDTDSKFKSFDSSFDSFSG